jgi:hypothetical protein
MLLEVPELLISLLQGTLRHMFQKLNDQEVLVGQLQQTVRRPCPNVAWLNLSAHCPRAWLVHACLCVPCRGSNSTSCAGELKNVGFSFVFC